MKNKKSKRMSFSAVNEYFKHLPSGIEISILLFLVFFALGALDTKTRYLAFETVISLSSLKFWIFYIAFYILLFFVFLTFPKVVYIYRPDKAKTKGKKFIHAVMISMYAFMIGELVSMTNGLIIALFGRLAWI